MRYDVYLIADPSRLTRGTLVEVVRAALDGGVTAVQLRDKSASTRALVEEGRRLRALTRERGVPLIVNDRLDVAFAVEANGVHLGPDDLPLDIARRLLPSGMLLGASIGTPAEAGPAERDGASYLGVGSVYDTTSKIDAGPPIGLAGLRAVRSRTSLPILAVGGITAARVEEVVAAGADGVAVMSAVLDAQDPAKVAREIADAVERGRRAQADMSGATGDAP
jgi:thiamine-phosphate pyrophosphorylase